VLHADLNEYGEAVLIQVENKVINEVEAVADNDGRELISKLRALAISWTRVLRGNLNYDLKVLTDVDSKHLL